MSTLAVSKKSLGHYLSLKYPIEITEDEGGWVASIPDLPGCESFGETVEGAIQNIQEAKELWLKSQLESGGEVPEPTNEDEFSGKFVLRIPRTLHRSLAYQAQKQGVSLNHYVSYLLSERHPLHILESTLERIAHFWMEGSATWVHHHMPRRNYFLLGARYPGDISAVTLLSKPAPRGAMKVPQSLEEQYQLTYAHNR